MSTDETDSRRPRFESGLGFLLSRVGSVVDSAWGEALAEHGLSNAQYNVLAVLAELGRLRQGDLAKLVAVDPRNIVKTVAALTRRGLAAAEPSPTDARVKTLAITDAGRGMLDAFATGLTPYRSRLTRALSPAETTELTRLLGKLYGDHMNGGDITTKRLGFGTTQPAAPDV